MPSPEKKPIEINLDNITAPPRTALSPREVFENDVRAEVERRTNEIYKRTFDYFTTGKGATFPVFKDIVTHDKAKYTESEYSDAVRGFVEKVQLNNITPSNPAMRPPPLFTTAQIAAHPYAATIPASLTISVVEDNLRKILDSHLENAIHDAIHDAIEHLNRQEQQMAKHTPDQPNAPGRLKDKQEDLRKLEAILAKVDKLSDSDIDNWIRLAANLMSPHDRSRLAMTGLVDLPSKKLENGNMLPAATAERGFGQLRTIKFLSALSSVGSIAGAAISIVSTGGLTGFGIAAGLALFNWVAQVGLQVAHNGVMEGTWKEIRRELDKAVPEGCAAWAGLFYKFIKEANPLWIAPNRTQVALSAYASSVESILDHLKGAAIASLERVSPHDEIVKSMNYKDHVKLCEADLKNLETRWNWWHEKQKMVAPYMAGGFGFGAVSFYSRTIVPLIP